MWRTRIQLLVAAVVLLAMTGCGGISSTVWSTNPPRVTSPEIRRPLSASCALAAAPAGCCNASQPQQLISSLCGHRSSPCRSRLARSGRRRWLPMPNATMAWTRIGCGIPTSSLSTSPTTTQFKPPTTRSPRMSLTLNCTSFPGSARTSPSAPTERSSSSCPLQIMCRHTVGLNWTAIGIEHVGTSRRADPCQSPADARIAVTHGVAALQVPNPVVQRDRPQRKPVVPVSPRERGQPANSDSPRLEPPRHDHLSSTARQISVLRGCERVPLQHQE